MNEPAGTITFSLLVVFVAWLGPTVGPYALIAFAAGAGGLLALTKRREGTRLDGLLYLSTTVLLALFVVGPLAWACEKWLAVPANIALAPVAALLGMFRDQLLEILSHWLRGLPAALASLNPFSAGNGRSGQ